MKTDFRRFRFLSRVATVILIVAVASFVLAMVFLDGNYRIAAVLPLMILGLVGAMVEAAAYDCLICPKCGKRIVKPLRESFTKENRQRFKAIDQGLPIKCIHCGQEVETNG